MNTDVLLVEDDAQLREALCDTLEMSGYATVASADGLSALNALKRQSPGIVVSDIQMRPMDGISLMRRIKKDYPEIPVLLMTAYATVQQAVDAMRDGATDYLVKPFEAEVLINKVSSYLPGDAGEDEGMVAVDPRSRGLLALARRVAESDATVMISGESGTGKEILARFIYNRSSRTGGPFVAINCAAIPDNMLEAVLFGYEKGAFTGAYKSSPGKFEHAQGGTLLLDEISEMDLGLQAKLLRVLQEREVERLGGSQLIPLDIRVLATSNRDMRAEVSEGRFREDLFYRLNVFPMHIPALRERPEDIVPLAEHLITRSVRTTGQRVPELSQEALERLRGYHWPGNVRELDNVIQRAMILQCGGSINEADLRFEQMSGETISHTPEVRSASEEKGGLNTGLKTRERDLILAALREGNGSRKVAAEKLGISPRTLRYKLQRLREAGMEIN